jgi:hypothetical protein
MTSGTFRSKSAGSSLATIRLPISDVCTTIASSRHGSPAAHSRVMRNRDIRRRAMARSTRRRTSRGGSPETASNYLRRSSTSGASGGHSTGGGTGSTAKTAGIGSAITLTGNNSGEQMSVTVTRVISSAEPGDEFTSAPAGDRLYAVQFRLRDTGSAAYSDAPSNGAAVVDSAGQSYQAAITDTAAGCTTFPGTENIAPGASGLGCIVFEVPKAANIREVQFTLDSGFGPQTGQWKVAG